MPTTRIKKSGGILASGISRLSSVTADMASIGILAMAVIIVASVVGRAIFQAGMLFAYAYEFSGYLLIFAAFLAMAEALKKGKHISIDLLVDKLSKRKKAFLRIVTSFFSLLFLGVFTYYGAYLVWISFAKGRTVESVLAPPAYLPQLLIPLGIFLMLMQLLVRLSGDISALTKK